MSTEWIEGLRVVDLRDELKKRDLAITGKKAELAARLLEAVEGEAPKEDEGAQKVEATPEEQPSAGKTKGSTPPAAEEPAADEPAADTAVEPERNEGQGAAGQDDEVEQPAEGAETADPNAAEQEGTEALLKGEAHEQVEGESPAEAAKTAAGAEGAKEEATPMEVGDEPDATQQAASPEALYEAKEVSEVATTAGEGALATEDKLAPMQAALLAPPASVAEADPDVGMEEEIAVDFEADDEPPAAITTPAVAKAAVEDTAGKKAKLSGSKEQPSSKRQKQQQDVGSEGKSASGAGRAKREPIPLFRPKSQRADVAKKDSTPAPSRGGSDAKASVFDRIGAQGGDGAVPKSSGAPPSRIKASCALLVTGFVRPFRVPAAQDLFKQHGEVKTFWMSSVRDKAYVIFQTEEAAEKARQAVHGLEWPERSRTSLRPKFIPVEEAEEVIKSNGANLPTRTSGLFSSRNSGSASMTPSTSNAAAAAAAAAAGTPLERRKSAQTAQEEGKKTAKSAVDPEEQPDQFQGLFKKTDTKPYLYWLPLTEEEIASKQSSTKQSSMQESNEKVKLP